MPANQKQCEDLESTCEGNVLKICMLGKYLHLDCSAFVNGRCDGGNCKAP